MTRDSKIKMRVYLALCSSLSLEVYIPSPGVFGDWQTCCDRSLCCLLWFVYLRDETKSYAHTAVPPIPYRLIVREISFAS